MGRGVALGHLQAFWWLVLPAAAKAFETTRAPLGIFANTRTMSVRFAISMTLRMSIKAHFRISFNALEATRAPLGICAHFMSMSARFMNTKMLCASTRAQFRISSSTLGGYEGVAQHLRSGQGAARED